MAVTPLRPAGTVLRPLPVSPQATTVPSLFSARLWESPTATFTTPLRPAGTVVWVKPY